MNAEPNEIAASDGGGKASKARDVAYTLCTDSVVICWRKQAKRIRLARRAARLHRLALVSSSYLQAPRGNVAHQRNLLLYSIKLEMSQMEYNLADGLVA